MPVCAGKSEDLKAEPWCLQLRRRGGNLTFTTRMRVVLTYPLRNLTRPKSPRAKVGPRTCCSLRMQLQGARRAQGRGVARADRWPAIGQPGQARPTGAADLPGREKALRNWISPKSLLQ